MLSRFTFALLIALTPHCGFAVEPVEPESFALTMLDEATLGLVRGAESNAFAVYSKTRKRWSTYHFPDYLTTIRPATLGESRKDNMHDLVVAFEMSGGPVTELVAVDCKGKFRVHKLETAINAELRPVLNGDGVIYYIVDEVVYAFSGKTGTWDTFKVPGLPEVQWVDGAGHVPGIKEHGFDTESEKGIVIRRPNGVARFLADKGHWQFTPADAKVGG